MAEVLYHFFFNSNQNVLYEQYLDPWCFLFWFFFVFVVVNKYSDSAQTLKNNKQTNKQMTFVMRLSVKSTKNANVFFVLIKFWKKKWKPRLHAGEVRWAGWVFSFPHISLIDLPARASIFVCFLFFMVIFQKQKQQNHCTKFSFPIFFLFDAT